MHELNIAKRILEEASRLGAKNSLMIEVGELCNFIPKELKETMETLTDLKIKLKVKKSLVECKCGYHGRAKILLKEHDCTVYVCPKCGRKPKVIEGDEVRILSVG